MQLRTIRHLWGVEEAWETFFPKIKELGYFGIETGLHFFNESDKNRLKSLCTKHNLKVVNQIHTDPYGPGVRNKTIQFHVDNLRKQATHAKEFLGDLLLFCNSHSGYEGWNMQQKEEYFAQAIAIQKELGIIIAHETHRHRCLYNPFETRDLMLKFPELKITADISHWFVVCEESSMDGEMDIIELLGKHTQHVHGRVGYAEGPQVPDPRAPEYDDVVQAHERCWDVIWEQQQKLGAEFSYFEPEFGPTPYLHALPYTKAPVANLEEICEYQTKRISQRFFQKYPKK